MAQITVAPVIPVGTTGVAVYPRSAWGPRLQGAPSGSATASSLTVASNGTVTATLAAGSDYVAYRSSPETFVSHSEPAVSSSGGSGMTLVAGGNLGATPSTDVTGKPNVLYTGTLTANATLTITGIAAGSVILLDVAQDGTGGRTLSVVVGGSTVSLPVNSAASAGSQFQIVSPDGTNAHIAALGSGIATATAAGAVKSGGDISVSAAGVVTVTALPTKADLTSGKVPLTELPAAQVGGVDLVRPTAAQFETFSRRFAQSSFAPGTGVLWLSAVWLPIGTVVTSVSILPTTTGSGTHGWAALYDNSGTNGGPGALLRQSTDDTSVAWTTNTIKTFTLSSTFTTTYSGFHYIGLMIVAGTMPTVASDPASVGTANQLPPLLTATGQGSLTTTAPTPVASIAAQSKQFYAYVS